jgi:Response regulators consisting of a CheY-like receiver domain and a winged-helix DNA-binding domain
MHELILIVDDNAKLLAGMKMRLEMVGYQVLVAGDGRDALDLLKSVTPNLIVADVMMPRMNGWELFERIRNDPRLCSIPIVFVTSRTDDESIQKGKGLGAEDYLTKPFKAEELEATIRGKLIRSAQLSRSLKSQPVDTHSKEIQIGDLYIDLNAHRVRRGDEEVSLSPTEFNILAQLGQKAGQIISMQELAEFNFPTSHDDWDAQDTIRVHIKNIRKKIEPDPSNPQYIVNIRGVGYRFETISN